MAEQNARSDVTLSPPGSVSYPDLFTPRSYQGGKPKQAVTLVYASQEAVAPIAQVIEEVLLKQYPPEQFPQRPPLHYPIRSAEDKRNWKDGSGAYKEGFPPGSFYCTFWRYPDQAGMAEVVDENRNPATPQLVYAGCHGLVAYAAVHYIHPETQSRGIMLSLEAFMRTGEGTPIGAVPVKAADVFGAPTGPPVQAQAAAMPQQPAQQPTAQALFQQPQPPTAPPPLAQNPMAAQTGAIPQTAPPAQPAPPQPPQMPQQAPAQAAAAPPPQFQPTAPPPAAPAAAGFAGSPQNGAPPF